LTAIANREKQAVLIVGIIIGGNGIPEAVTG
jgi:hypothetical protein